MIIQIKKNSEDVCVKVSKDSIVEDFDYINFIELLYNGEIVDDIEIDEGIDADKEQVKKLIEEIAKIVEENKKV